MYRSSITLSSKAMKKIVYAIVAFVMIALSGTTHATDVKAGDLINLHVGGNYSTGILSVVNNVHKAETGGSIDPSSLGGRALDYLYCVDLFTDVNVNADYPYTTVNNAANIHGNTLLHADKVAYLLGKYGVGGQGEQAKALQAAIWHEIYAPGVYDLDVASYGSTSKIATLYTQYVTEAATHAGDVSKFLWINPGKDATGLTTYQGLVTSSPTPEPGTIMLLGAGMLGLRVFGKRRMMNKEA
jgi:hypothetical protein